MFLKFLENKNRLINQSLNFQFKFTGIMVTVLLIDRLGRRVAMAVEFLLLTAAVSLNRCNAFRKI